MSSTAFDEKDVTRTAKLANVPLDKNEIHPLTVALQKTIDVVNQLNTLPTKNIEPTSQVTGLENVWREDIVDEARMFSQDAALKNALRKHDGYFLVPAVFEEE